MIFYTIMFLIVAGMMGGNSGPKTEDWIRKRVVQLDSVTGNCSAIQVHADNNKDYLLTAAHCKPLELGGKIMGIFDGKAPKFYKIIKEDDESDLLLLEGEKDLRGVDIAEHESNREAVFTLTHGKHLKTYRTDGIIVDEIKVNIPVYKILTANDKSECIDKMKYGIEKDDSDGSMWCMLRVPETVSTAFIVPGSSGGAVLNSDGELVGIVSAMSEGFAFFVTLQDIRRFVND